MNPSATRIAVLILVTGVGVAAWAWLAMAQVKSNLRTFSGFDGLHLDA